MVLVVVEGRGWAGAWMGDDGVGGGASVGLLVWWEGRVNEHMEGLFVAGLEAGEAGLCA